MNEDFLQYVWKFQRFTSQQLTCADGQSLEVIQTGIHNFNAGPDFLNARLRIGDTVWGGNVEVHINASDWYKHKHHQDPAYDNVILHVVFSNDKAVLNPAGQEVPVLALKDLIDYQIFRYYKSWVKKASFIPCEELVGSVPDIVKTAAVQSEAVNRIEEKAGRCIAHLSETRGDIEEVFYRVLCRALGLSVNAMPFETLSRRAPIKMIRKNRESLLDIEALLLGQAGFLDGNNANEAYISQLKAAYAFQQKKYKLEPMPRTAWKLSRMRPQNFPVVRLAQLAHIYFQNRSLAQKIIDAQSVKTLMDLFSVSLDTDFWKSHYTLDNTSDPVVKSLGISSIRLLIVNAVIPFLFGLASYNKDEQFKKRAIRFLEEIPPEKNTVLSKFTKLDFKSQSAFDSQGLLGLKKNRCDRLKCLNCKIGIYILKQNGTVHQPDI